MIALGWSLFVPGLVLTPLPPPFAFGLFMMMPGLVILLIYSSSVRRTLRKARRRYHWLNISVIMLEKRAPGKMGRILRTTRPKRKPVSPIADRDIAA
jgi:hypothetical protein